MFLIIYFIFPFSAVFYRYPPYHNRQQVSLVITLQQELDFSYKGQKFSIKTPTNQLILVSANTYPLYHYGEVVQISGKLKIFSFPDGKTIFTMYHPKIVLQQEADNPIAAVADGIRLQIRGFYKATLPPVSASLLMRMVLGANEKFPDEFRQALQTTGVLPVIAASGCGFCISGTSLFTGLIFKTADKHCFSAVLESSFMSFLLDFSHQFSGQTSWDYSHLVLGFWDARTSQQFRCF